MKNEIKSVYAVAFLLICFAGTARAELTATNRLSVSARVGFNIDAGFQYNSSRSLSGVGRVTPDGDPYNYDDGYVLLDSSGSGTTWYWGYDDAPQVSVTEILMNRTEISSDSGMGDMEGSTPTVGAELTYSHMLEITEKHRFGFDFSIGFIPLDFEEHSQVTEYSETVTDGYAFTVGTTPPTAPYEGSFNGPGFLISTMPTSSGISSAPGQTYNVDSELQGFLWSTRIGPFLEYPLSEALTLHMALGLSLGILDVDADWSADGTTPSRGGGRDTELLSGGFIGADLFWEIEDDWHIATGLEFEYLNDWEKDFGSGMYTLDFSKMYYLTIGLMHEF